MFIISDSLLLKKESNLWFKNEAKHAFDALLPILAAIYVLFLYVAIFKKAEIIIVKARIIETSDNDGFFIPKRFIKNLKNGIFEKSLFSRVSIDKKPVMEIRDRNSVIELMISKNTTKKMFLVLVNLWRYLMTSKNSRFFFVSINNGLIFNTHSLFY